MSNKDIEKVDTVDRVGIPRGELASRADAEARQESGGSSRTRGDATTPGPTELQAVRRATGKPRDAALSHEQKYEFVVVEYMKRDFEYDGVVYHSGFDRRIPKPLAAVLGLYGSRTAVQTTRAEEQDGGLKVESHPTAVESQENVPFNAIPVSDPSRELPSQAERDAVHDREGTSSEKLNEKARAANGESPPRASAASKSAKKDE